MFKMAGDGIRLFQLAVGSPGSGQLGQYEGNQWFLIRETNFPQSLCLFIKRMGFKGCDNNINLKNLSLG